MATQLDDDQTPAWVARMRARGYGVTDPKPGSVIKPFEAVRESGPLVAFWRRTMRRLREKRVVP